MLSTGGMLDYAREHAGAGGTAIMATETGMLHPLRDGRARRRLHRRQRARLLPLHEDDHAAEAARRAARRSGEVKVARGRRRARADPDRAHGRDRLATAVEHVRRRRAGSRGLAAHGRAPGSPSSGGGRRGRSWRPRRGADGRGRRGALPVGDAPEPDLLRGVGDDGRALFAVEADGQALTSLRDAGRAALAGRRLALLAQAAGLLNWHRRHRFCANCGAPTAMPRPATSGVPGLRRRAPPAHRPGGDHARHRGDRGAARPPGDLAGGPLQRAGGLRRAGGEPGGGRRARGARGVGRARSRDVRYRSSQPWPFPTSLMLGFHARAGRRRAEVARRRAGGRALVQRDD